MKIIRAIILIGTIIGLVVITSCSHQNNVKIENLPTSIILKSEPGWVYTLCPEIARITEYDFVEKEHTYVIKPVICAYEDSVYMYQDFKFTSEVAGYTKAEADAFFKGDALKEEPYRYEIFVYNSPISEKPDRIITLKGLPEYRIAFMGMYFNPVSKTLMLAGTDRYGNGEQTELFYYEFDLEGNMVNKKHVPEISKLAYMILCDGYIYHLEECSQNLMTGVNEFKIWRYDPLTERHVEIDAPHAYALFENNGIVYYISLEYGKDGSPEYQNLYAIQGEESVLIAEGFNMLSYDANDIEYDAENRILYFTNYDYIYTLHLDDGEIRQLMVSGDKSLYLMGITNSALIIRNGQYATSAYERKIDKCSLSDNQITLNLYRYMGEDNTDLHQDVFRIMNINGYSTKGRNFAISDINEYQFTMAKKLLAGDTDFDIFYVSTEMHQLMKKQYYEDLSVYPLLEQYYNKMVPGVKELCVIDGSTALIPLNLYTSSMRIDKSCLTSDIAFPDTWPEFMDIRTNIQLNDGSYMFSGVYNHTLVAPLFEQYVSNFMGGIISDSQAENDLKILFELTVNLLKDSDVRLGIDYNMVPTLIRIGQNIGRDSSLSSSQIAIPMMKVSNEYKHTWNGGFYAINPNSSNKEMAAVFLACLMERDRNLGSGNAQLYKDAHEKTSIVRGNGSDALYEVYLTQLADGVREYAIPDLGSTLRELFQKIESGECSTKDAADDLFRKLKMIKYE